MPVNYFVLIIVESYFDCTDRIILADPIKLFLGSHVTTF